MTTLVMAQSPERLADRKRVGNVPGEDPTAVWLRRALAAVMDLGLFALATLAVFLVVAERKPNWGLPLSTCQFSGGPCADIRGTTYLASGSRLLLLVVVSGTYLLCVFVLHRGRTGRTVGMNTVGIRVVDGQGNPPGLTRALTRSVANIADYLPFCVPLVGATAIATSPFHQRVGDMAARTFVVRSHAVGRPVGPPIHTRDRDTALAADRSEREQATARASLAPSPRSRYLTAACWVATAVGGTLSVLMLAVFWTTTYWVDSQYCGTVLGSEGSCSVALRGAFVAVSIGVASLPALVVAGPFWVVALLSRRRRVDAVSTEPAAVT